MKSEINVVEDELQLGQEKKQDLQARPWHHRSHRGDDDDMQIGIEKPIKFCNLVLFNDFVFAN